MDDENNLQNDIRENIKTIHTYGSDMADVVRANEASVIKIALAEQKKKEQEMLYREVKGSNASKIIYVIAGLIVIALGIFGFVFLTNKKEANNVVQTVNKNIETIISYDNKSFIDINNIFSVSDLANVIAQEDTKDLKQGQIKSLFLTKNLSGVNELTTTEDLVSLMKLTANSSFIRSLDDKYMLGLYKKSDLEENLHMFLILKNKDYNQAYAGMLSWEKTLLDDMFIIFGIDVSGERSYLFERPWRDIIIVNKDARILYDLEGNEILYYLFLDESTLLIANKIETIKEVNQRFINKQTKPL